VSDSGIGIASDALPHVFERFWQADAGMTRKAGGLGLGLSIVHHLVELHGGSVDVMSAGVGQGATFRVRLPVRIVHAEPASEQHEHPRTEQAAKLSTLSNLSGIRVLSVDDDRDALELLRIVLETAGAHVVGISSAAEALRAIDAAKPDVLLVDLGMPDMNGFDFIARVRASSNLDVRDTPAAALTAFARSEDRTRALSSGFEMHLAKPIDPGELVASVARLARRAKSR
jgi:CheY-like chemotaxis protein